MSPPSFEIWLPMAPSIGLQGSPRDREKRDRERSQLSDLGGLLLRTRNAPCSCCALMNCSQCYCAPSSVHGTSAIASIYMYSCCFLPLPAVGKNLTYLSQLDGLTFQLYRDVVLPR